MKNTRALSRVLGAIGLAGALAVPLAAPAHAANEVPIDWKVDATTTMKSLGQTVVIPTGSFKGSFDLSTGQLTGDLSLPQATQRLDIGKLPLAKVTFAMEQAAPITGSLNIFTMEAKTTASFNVRIVSVKPVIAPWLNLVGKNCRTREPVTTEIGGKVDLAGKSTFSGEYALGKFKNCGFGVTEILNAVVPGDGNTMSATFYP